ncbi:MAG: glycosyltransferase family 4 protein [candidate division WOR-3 bacterium]
MRIIFASYPSVTILGGGVEVQMRSLAKELQKLGIEVDFFDPWRRYDFTSKPLIHLFAAHVGTYHLGRAFHNLGARLVVSPVFYSRHSPAYTALAVRLSLLLRRLGPVWTDYTFCHDLCHMAVRVVPNTRAEADLITRSFGVEPERVAVVPNGVDESFLDANPELFVKRYGLRDFVLYVGHIGLARKNPLRLLRAMKGLPVPVVLIGHYVDTPYGRACLQAAKDHGQALVLPALPPGDELLKSAYAACGVFVLPSYYETPGISALEAGLAGARVCITKHGGTTEFFGDLVEYIEPRSEASIRSAVQLALNRPRGDALRNYVRENYLWGRAARELSGVYEEL